MVHDVVDECLVVDLPVGVLEAQVVALRPLVGLLWLRSIEEHPELARVASNHEAVFVVLFAGRRFSLAHLEGQHRVNFECGLVRRRDHDVLVVAVGLKQKDLTRLRAHDESSVVQPRVAHEIGRNGV